MLGRLLGFFFAAAFLLAASARADDATALIARYKDASGGAAWDNVKTLHATGTLSTGGLAAIFRSCRTSRPVARRISTSSGRSKAPTATTARSAGRGIRRRSRRAGRTRSQAPRAQPGMARCARVLVSRAHQGNVRRRRRARCGRQALSRRRGDTHRRRSGRTLVRRIQRPACAHRTARRAGHLYDPTRRLPRRRRRAHAVPHDRGPHRRGRAHRSACAHRHPSSPT